MTDFEEELSFGCPFCGEVNTLRVDLTGGNKQKFVMDCETCCHPILIKFERDEDGLADFSAEKE